MTQSTQVEEPAEAASAEEHFEPPTLWGLARAHKRISGAVVAVIVSMLAIVLVTDLGSQVTALTDSSPCSLWSSANQHERDAYAAQYVRQHGPLPSGASDAPTIEGVIDNGCTQAYGFDEADTVTVLESIRHQY